MPSTYAAEQDKARGSRRQGSPHAVSVPSHAGSSTCTYRPRLVLPFVGPATVASTAEEKPPRLHLETAHRTATLRQLHHTLVSPLSLPRQNKSPGAQKTTPSQPVVVRTYSGPSQPQSSPRRVCACRLSPRHSQSLPRSGARLADGQDLVGGRAKAMDTIARGQDSSKPKSWFLSHLPWPWFRFAFCSAARQRPDELHIPPVEAFTLKSIMANVQAEGGDMETRLDRIAEICARSHYSLSNQYDVHVSPHGLGAMPGGLASAPSASVRRRTSSARGQGLGAAPMLRGVDYDSVARHSIRQTDQRRRGLACITLETIVSSQSSDEDKSEMAADLGSRAARETTGSGSTLGSGAAGTGISELQKSLVVAANTDRRHTRPTADAKLKLARRKSAIFTSALMDSSRQALAAAALVSEPALPKTSPSCLGICTTPNARPGELESTALFQASRHKSRRTTSASDHFGEPVQASGASILSGPFTRTLLCCTQAEGHVGGASSSGSGPRRNQACHAKRSLRQLLQGFDATGTSASSKKGKAVVYRGRPRHETQLG